MKLQLSKQEILTIRIALMEYIQICNDYGTNVEEAKIHNTSTSHRLAEAMSKVLAKICKQMEDEK